MTPEDAKRIIARHLISCLLTENDVQWEDWPDIGQYDWEEIDQQICDEGRTFSVHVDDVTKAYKLLRERTDQLDSGAFI